MEGEFLRAAKDILHNLTEFRESALDIVERMMGGVLEFSFSALAIIVEHHRNA